MASFLSAAYRNGLLKDEVAIITGAGQGIGRSAAMLFAKEGAKVVVSDIDVGLAEAVAADICQAGGEAIAVGGDVCADDFPEQVVGSAIRNFGKINHIVNNAGFPLPHMIKDMPDDAFDVMYKVHVRSPFRLIRHASPYFCIADESRRENRSIVNVSSILGVHGGPGQANYATAKSALLGLTKSLAKEWGPFGVRVNTAVFGVILTRLCDSGVRNANMEVSGQTFDFPVGLPTGILEHAARETPLQRNGDPDEAAASILFLCSPLASFVSGHTLEVTGGALI